MHQVFTEIGIINQLAEAFLRHLLPKPLTIAQFHVLTHLTRLPGPHKPTELTNAFQVTKGAMTHSLGLLSKNGWVAITPDPIDKRSKQVEITDAGREVFATTIAKLSPYYAEMGAAFPSEELSTLSHTLEKIRIFMDNNRDLEIK